MPVQAVALVLGEHHDFEKAAVDKVGERKIDQAVLPPDGHGRLRAVPAERMQSGSPATRQDHRQNVACCHALTLPQRLTRYGAADVGPSQNGGTMTERAKYLLDESDLPRRWYNIIPDLPSPPPPVLHPGRLDPVGPDDLAPLFPMVLIGQEVSGDRYLDIPEPVLDVYRLWRPTPLVRARRLERALDTPARIYYKYEGTSPTGSHKPNTAVPQAYYNAVAGVRR